MSSGPDFILDIAGLKRSDAPKGDARTGRGSARPWVAVRWRCCGMYSRVYRNKQGTAYEARCPRCGAPVRLRVGPGGTSARFFEAG